MIALEIQQAKKWFGGVRAVNGFTVRFEKGKVTSLIGPNGAGKSTIVDLMSGVQQMDSGSIRMLGTNIKTVRAHDMKAYGLTRTFQSVQVFEQMSVLDNILVVLTERGVLQSIFEKHKDFHVKQARVVLERVQLWEKRDELAEDLSYGQRKLLEIARVLAMDTDIILFDEPFAGLFKEMVATVADIIKELRAAGKTVLLIEHNMKIIRDLSDHVVVVDAGEFLAEGTPEKVLNRKDVIEAYLGE